MARKIFVSYKHGDTQIEQLPEGLNLNKTCRDYVDTIMQLIAGVEIYKGEDADNDLSQFKDTTIRTHLKEKIRDSSITIVLISKGMKEQGKGEKDQWIPWEVKYSLRRKAYGEKKSNSNGMLAVIIPEADGTYDHFIQKSNCASCNTRTFKTAELFEILKNNMFNRKQPVRQSCPSPAHNSTHHVGNNHSYIHQVEWGKFINNPSYYLDIAEGLKDSIEDFVIQKRVIAPAI
jgi:hypothetical protein